MRHRFEKRIPAASVGKSLDPQLHGQMLHQTNDKP
jgi:hypothetical protein